MNKTLLNPAFNNGLLEKKCFFFEPINIKKFSKKLKKWDKNPSSKLSDFSFLSESALRASNENFFKSNPCRKNLHNVASSKLGIYSKAAFNILQNKAIHSKAVYSKAKNTLFVPEKKQDLMHRELIEWGCHIGHKPLRLANKSKREFYPVVSKYLLGKRQNLNYIDVQFSIKQTLSAMYTIACILNKGGSFLIVNTNQIFDELMSPLKRDVVENDLKNMRIYSNARSADSYTAKLCMRKDLEKLSTQRKIAPACAKSEEQLLWQKAASNKTMFPLPHPPYEEGRPHLNRLIGINSGITAIIKSETILREKKDKKANSGNGIAFTQYKWIGGALSNWDQISKTVWRVAKFSEEFEMFLKTHNINFPVRDFSIPSTLVSEFSIPRYEELKKSFRGLVEKQNTSTYLCFQKKPDLILLVNSTENLSIVREANSLRIPVMALTDSNTNLSGISYPIPVNSESISFFFRFLDLISRINKRN